MRRNKVYVDVGVDASVERNVGVYVGRGTWRERRRTRNGKRGTRGEENGRREDRGSAEAHTTTAIRPPLHPIDDNDDDDDVAATSSIILISTINVRPLMISTILDVKARNEESKHEIGARKRNRETGRENESSRMKNGKEDADADGRAPFERQDGDVEQGLGIGI